jgi:hypothetical protein
MKDREYNSAVKSNVEIDVTGLFASSEFESDRLIGFYIEGNDLACLKFFAGVIGDHEQSSFDVRYEVTRVDHPLHMSLNHLPNFKVFLSRD